MTPLDYAVVILTLVSIAAFGVWKSRDSRDLEGYLQAGHSLPWATIGLSVMATQASAITFLSTPGLGYEDGLRFVQNYLGLPIAMVIICAVFLPIYRRLKVYTAYEYLGHRFDQKTRRLGASLFLLQRGLAAGITLYAPAIILSTVFGWQLDATILLAGLLVIGYTVSGGTKAVSLTQKWQMSVILLGMGVAFLTLLHQLSQHVSMTQALTIAGQMGKLEAIDFSFSLSERYNFWSGLLGGTFLALSYFGTDQSQVQRYLSGRSLAASRLGLLFNAVLKIPMQFTILLLGALLFVFYQFEKPPIYFKQSDWQQVKQGRYGAEARELEQSFSANFESKRESLQSWGSAVEPSREEALRLADREKELRQQAKALVKRHDPGLETKDSDYVFITYVLGFLPKGLVGLLVAVIFCAAMSSTASELNALASTAVVDFYRPLLRPEAEAPHYLLVSKLFTAGWGMVALGFALYAHLVENLIEAVNILGSLFYGVVLGLFLVAFFFKKVGADSVFWSAILSQILVLVLFFRFDIGYLWFNVIGCLLTILFSLVRESLR